MVCQPNISALFQKYRHTHVILYIIFICVIIIIIEEKFHIVHYIWENVQGPQIFIFSVEFSCVHSSTSVLGNLI